MEIVCQRCRQDHTVTVNKNCRRRYCDECQPIVLRDRKKLERQKRLGRVLDEKPRLVRYAGFDPSERNK
jgi:hypothetical protein